MAGQRQEYIFQTRLPGPQVIRHDAVTDQFRRHQRDERPDTLNLHRPAIARDFLTWGMSSMLGSSFRHS